MAVLSSPLNPILNPTRCPMSTIPPRRPIIARVTLASQDDALSAVEAASRAQKKWRALTAIERGEHLRRFADAIVERAPQIGAALALESGKSVADSENEARYAADITRYHAEWARRIEGEVIPSDTPNENLVLHREPIGVVACLIPFNYPGLHAAAQGRARADRGQHGGRAAEQ